MGRTSVREASRLGAYLRFLAAIFYFFAARALAARATGGISTPEWSSLAEQIFLLFLLVVGFSSMGFWFDKQMHPITEQGLPRRRGWTREAGLGISLGWGIALVPVLAMALIGGIATSFTAHWSNLGWFLVNLAFFAVAALAEEVAFRGYGFQCFERAVGGLGATFVFAAFYAILASLIPGASRVSVLSGVALMLLLSAAYLRTRALWVGWGINFAWKASRALVFGLSVAGVNSRSPIVQGNPMGPFWLTGGAYGLEASWFALVVLLAALPVVFRATEDLNFLHNAPVFEPGGIAVDLDAAARAQHEAATTAPAAPALVQILPASAPVAQTPGIPLSSGEDGRSSS
jgi:hypothetical protein